MVLLGDQGGQVDSDRRGHKPSMGCTRCAEEGNGAEDCHLPRIRQQCFCCRQLFWHQRRHAGHHY
eukprot:8639367-Prorocentrum_lima.AAC.1